MNVRSIIFMVGHLEHNAFSPAKTTTIKMAVSESLGFN
jgi:hypothetical protein